MIPTLRELHERFRSEGRGDRSYTRRLELVPRECRQALRHDADKDGLCRWCKVRCDKPVGRPRGPYGVNEGDALIQAAYDLHYGNDEPVPADWESHRVIREERW